MAAVLSLFLTRLAIGIAASLLLVAREAGVQFFRFNAGLGGVLLLIALAFRPGIMSSGSPADTVAFAFLILVTATLLFYWATVGRILSGWRPVLLWVTTVGGLIALIAQAMMWSALEMGPSTLLAFASFVSSAALLGSSCTAMILGHWYLVLPSMDVSLLQRMVKFHIVSTIARIIVVGIVISTALINWQSPTGAGFEQYMFSIEGVFLWQRLLFGLFGPVVLAYMTWETAKIQSTQSATGILYVDFFTVIVGEVLATYLLVSQRVPL